MDEELAARLTAYYELLSRWNRKINLTALDDPDEAIDRLLLEPIAASRTLVPLATPPQLLDVGSGGGSPAIPLALSLGSDTSLTMVEAKARKSAFLREAIRQLGLTAVVETSRYEELLGRPEMLERFSLLSVRAVRVEPRVLMTLQAFLRPGGQLLLFRGPIGPDVPAHVLHPLEWAATVPLVEAVHSRLTTLRKRQDGRSVSRGTPAPAPASNPIIH